MCESITYEGWVLEFSTRPENEYLRWRHPCIDPDTYQHSESRGRPWVLTHFEKDELERAITETALAAVVDILTREAHELLRVHGSRCFDPRTRPLLY